MAKCHRNVVGSLGLDHRAASSSDGSGHFRIWTALSGSSFRRKIFDAVSCGGSSRFRHHMEEEIETVSTSTATATTTATIADACSGSDERKSGKQGEVAPVHTKSKVKSEKLSDLLIMAEAENEMETKRKEEALEEFMRVVRELQCEEEARRTRAASKVRLLAKDDSEARVTLAMLGAIPPLVGLLDLEDLDAQIASLYALLNLCIGNDA